MPSKPSPSGGQLTSKRLGRVAVVHALQDGQVAVLWASGSPTNLTIDRHQIMAPVGVFSAIKTSKADATVGLIPGAQCPMRMVPGPSPAGEEHDVLSALALIAEANLPSSLPEHRRTAGVLRAHGGSAVCAVGFTGEPPASLSSLAIDAWVPAPVALAGLLGLAERAPAWVLHADGATGLIMTAAADGKQVGVRALRDDPADAEPWVESVSAAAASACALAGTQPAAEPLTPPSAGETLLVRPAAVRVTGAPDTAAWWRTFALLVGAATVALSEGTPSRALLSMTAQPPVVKAQPLISLVNWLGRPRVAACVGTLAVGALLLAPLGLAYARLTLLRQQAAGSTGTDAQYTTAEQQADFYTLLREKRWPMTQLLGEIIGSAPAGVSLESITMDQGQPVRIAGTTASDSLVTQDWRTALRASQVFDEVNIVSIDNTQLPTRFTLDLKVGQPTLALSREAAKLPPVAVQTPREIVEGSGDGGATSNVSGTRPPARTGAPTGRTGAPTVKRDIPKPISDEQINALSKAQATLEWAKRKGASQFAEIDESTRQRLIDEAAKLDIRRNSAGGGGAP